jgi:hypothetical protein
MTDLQLHDEEQLGRLIGLLPPAPEGWVRAAQEIPAFRQMLDGIVARAEADAVFRRAAIADLEVAIADAGYEPEARVVAELRRQISGLQGESRERYTVDGKERGWVDTRVDAS